MPINYQTPYTGITERDDTTLESSGMVFSGVTTDGAGSALRATYANVKADRLGGGAGIGFCRLYSCERCQTQRDGRRNSYKRGIPDADAERDYQRHRRACIVDIKSVDAGGRNVCCQGILPSLWEYSRGA